MSLDVKSLKITMNTMESAIKNRAIQIVSIAMVLDKITVFNALVDCIMTPQANKKTLQTALNIAHLAHTKMTRTNACLKLKHRAYVINIW